MHSNKQFHFSSILASTVHDIKNSLGAVQGLVTRLADQYRADHNPEFKQLEFEAKRMNHSLMQLLVLYKIDSDRFSLNIDEHDVLDILNEIEAQLTPLLQQNQIHLTLQCEEDLLVYCDATQISNALSTLLNNAQRYSRQHIILSASQQQSGICICIEDDGQGYPANYLDVNTQNPNDIDWVSGNTGLGLYFASIIASLHTNGQQQGHTLIDNQSSLGGARFRLYLP